MTQLIKSDSTTSLSELPIVDTACRFCSGAEDAETGKSLIDARIFLSCDCRLTTHLDCWKEYVADQAGRLVCPSCEKPIPTWKVSNELPLNEPTKMKSYVREIAIGLAVICVILFLAFLIIYVRP
jgi:hypothetical protein